MERNRTTLPEDFVARYLSKREQTNHLILAFIGQSGRTHLAKVATFPVNKRAMVA